MDIYPAIDIRGGACVRLAQGDFARESVYGADPVVMAIELAAGGAPWLHVVDLDAARTGRPENRATVGAIAAAVTIPVQSGGGVRDEAAAEALFGLGVTRVVIGTAALEDPAMVHRLAARHPSGVAVGLDARGGDLAVRGWTEGAGRSPADAVALFCDAGVAAFVVTDIGRDGMLTGPDLEGLAAVLSATTTAVIASGGVSSLDDLRALQALVVDGRQLSGAIVGKALYEGAFSVAEAVAVCAT